MKDITEADVKALVEKFSKRAHDKMTQMRKNWQLLADAWKAGH